MKLNSLINARRGSVVSRVEESTDFEFAALARATRYRTAIRAEFAPFIQGEVVEIGAGIGQMSAELASLPAISRLTCVEPDPRFAQRLVESVPSARVIQGTASALPAGETWDAIVSINVLEHIEHDAEELRSWAGRLRRGTGHLCLLVPARPELYSPIDRDFGHWRRYRKQELRLKLERAGLRVTRLYHFNFIGYFAWAVTFRLLRRRRFNVASVRMFDRLIFPATHWLETRILRPPVGQSLIAIARAGA